MIEYKGVTYRDGCWIDADGVAHISAARCIDQNEPGRDDLFKQERLTDDDHKHLLALRNAVKPTLEEVVHSILLQFMDANDAQRAWTQLRAAGFDAPRERVSDADELVSRWDREQIEAVVALARELGWNGVDNSKLLSVFLRDYIEQQATPRPLTAAECVARLVELGAKRVTAVSRVVKDDKATNVYAYGEDVLILPTEAAQ